jgi:PPK2 family polyphosphate:nucleotide phosphotransferase
VDPAGCEVYSFKQPSAEELDHDFLWRTAMRLPQRGRIGVFNRSWYEEVLIVRVHPELLEHQKLPGRPDLRKLWRDRFFESIREHEAHLVRNGTVVLKFWLNVSREEQRKRFADRLEEPEKHWKFHPRDVQESEHWDRYMEAYEEAIRATSTAQAPWYVIPADHKPSMRVQVAEIVVGTLRRLKLEYPRVSAAEAKELRAMKKRLRS